MEHDRIIQKRIHKQRNKKQFVLVRVFGAANVIVWMPILVLTITLAVVDGDAVPLGYYSFFFFMHSVVHPLIEGCFIPEIKATIKKLMGISFCSKRFQKEKNDPAPSLM